MKDDLQLLVDEFLEKVYRGTAHPHRRQVLQEFVEWGKGREEFHRECEEKVNTMLGSIPGLERAV